MGISASRSGKENKVSYETESTKEMEDIVFELLIFGKLSSNKVFVLG